MFDDIWFSQIMCLFQNLDHLSDEDKQKYKENFELINSLKIDLQVKKEKYKNNEKLYERFIPGIVSTIEDTEAENKHLLEAKVPFQICCIVVEYLLLVKTTKKHCSRSFG